MLSVFAVKGSVDDVLSIALKGEKNFNAYSNILVKFLSNKSETSIQISPSVDNAVKTAQKPLKPITQSKIKPNGKLYELTEIRFYETGSEDVKRSERKYTTSFFKDTARYINAEVNFKNLAYKKQAHNHKITRKWFNPDGSLRGKIDGTINVKSDWATFLEKSAWGWDTPGNWPLGEYLVEIYVDDVKIGEKKYKVIDKGFVLTRVLFFEHGAKKTEKSQRKYATRFYRDSTRFINNEIHFKNLWHNRQDQTYKVARVWYDENSMLEGTQDGDLIIKSQWEYCNNTSNGWGWKDPGKWAIGKYKLEVYVNNNLEDTQYFEIIKRE
ncbi:MAG: hypothetical protein GXP56_03765 [Deltaproteobacteria bacterium]|nr:hypothetical protein [Deltaproteobacteria bacterium]